jgi:hypothetical protein
MSRDLNRPVQLRLLARRGMRYSSNIALIDAFRPVARRSAQTACTPVPLLDLWDVHGQPMAGQV